MRTKLKAAVATAALALASGTLVAVLPAPAQAHGTPMIAGSRTWLCVKDGLTPQGNIVTINPACQESQRTGGDTAYFNWFGHLQSDGGGRTIGFIPDGKLCSANNPTFAGFDLNRDDWPVTHLTAGASMEFQYNNWAKHPGTFFQYITKDTWSPTRMLTWNDIEGIPPAGTSGPGTPFNSITDPQQIGGPGTVDGHYFWTARLPANKTGRHIIYTVWSRSDSRETFYSCSDVVFDGGNGQVTGVNRDENRNPIGGNPSSGPPSSNPPSSSPPSSNPPSSSRPPSSNPPSSSRPASSNPVAGCSATWKPIGAWNGNKYQVEITIRNTGTATTGRWSTTVSLGAPGTIDQVWNAAQSGTGTITLSNVSYNGTITGGGTTVFGFIANGVPPATTPTLPCTSA